MKADLSNIDTIKGEIYKVEVQADSTGTWCGNALTFDTVDKAKDYARDLYSRWTAVREWRVVEIANGAVVAQKSGV